MGRPAGHYKVASKNDLTPRQREVLDLIVRGRTNGEIAEHLGITLDGAKWHVSEILARLGVTSREEAAEWYRAQGRRFPRPVLRGLLPGWLVKAGAGAGVAAVAGIASLALFTGGDDAPPAAPPTDECDPSTLETIHRQYPDRSTDTVILDLEVISPTACLLEAGLVVRVRTSPSTRAGSLDDQALVRMVTAVSQTVRTDAPARFTVRWSNWCEPLPPGSRVLIDMFLVDPTPGPSAETAGQDIAAGAIPGCLNPAEPSMIRVATAPTILAIDGPCHPSEVQSVLTQHIRDDGAMVFEVAASSTRGCELVGSVTGTVGRAYGSFSWGLGPPMGQSFAVAVGPQPVVIGTGVWSEWCYQELNAFVEVVLQVGSAGALHHAIPVAEQPGCRSSVAPGTGVVDLGPDVQFEVGSAVALRLDCSLSPGCTFVTGAFDPGNPPGLGALLEGPSGRFRVMGPGQTFPVTIERAEFETIVRPLLNGYNNSLLAIGCSDKDGPGTCIAMDLVLQLRNGSAFALAFDNSSGTPVLFGVTPEIDPTTLHDRRQAIFGTANYITFDPPFPLFLE